MGNRNVPRQSAVNAGVVEALIGEQGGDNGVVSTLVSEQIREEQEQERKHPCRPTERRRQARKITVTFSDADIVKQLRGLAQRWGLVSNNGSLNVSAVVEYLLLPQLEAAKRGKVGPPPASQNELVEGEQWF